MCVISLQYMHLHFFRLPAWKCGCVWSPRRATGGRVLAAPERTDTSPSFRFFANNFFSIGVIFLKICVCVAHIWGYYR